MFSPKRKGGSSSTIIRATRRCMLCDVVQCGKGGGGGGGMVTMNDANVTDKANYLYTKHTNTHTHIASKCGYLPLIPIESVKIALNEYKQRVADE